MRNYLWIALIAAALAGCSSTPTTEAPVDDRSATAGAGGAGSAGAQTGGATGGGVTGSAVGAGGGNPLRDPNNILSKRSVYFDFDSNAVKDEYRNLITAHSRYMTADKRDARIRIEGNCDERGSREYNLALGQRRAESVRQAMVLSGVRADALEAISYGEERPRLEGHDEKAWAQNRRSDFARR